MSKRKSFHLPGSYRHFLPDKDFRTESIKVKLRVDPEKKTISGSCTLTLQTIREGLPSIRLDACEMAITRVLLDGSDARYDYDGRVLAVRGAGPIGAALHQVTVEYSARPTRGVYFIHPDPAYPDKPVQVWTQSESEAARYWFPCYDHPNSKAATETTIEAPEGYQVVSTGKLTARTSSGGWTSYTWVEAAPHSTYLDSFVVGKFVETKDEAEGVPLQYYSPKEKNADTMRYFGLTPDMMRVFDRLTDYKYPYEKYAQVAVHDFVYGGMENISATTLVDNRYPDARSEEDYAARYSRPDRDHIELVAHELAHAWFGDLVTTKDWPHAWLNEGFATYFEALYHENKFGKDEFRQNLQFKAATYFEEDAEKYRRAIVDDDYLYADDLFDSHLYEKGAWMLHQLRYRLGDDLFFRGVREYLKRFAYKNVDTHDFMNVMEDVTGLSLGSYFEQSFFRGGHPEMEVEYSWDAETKTAHVSVAQTQSVDDLTPIFQFPCDLVFYTQKGRERKKVWMRGQRGTFAFELSSEPTIVELDPEGWLLKKLDFKKSRSLLVNQLLSSNDALSRKEAAEGLASFKDDSTVASLRQAVDTEQHWSVRAEAARSIGKVGGAHSLDVLLELHTTRNRRVRRAVIAALADFRGDDRVRQLLREALLHDESPYVQCEAALSLAKTEAGDAVPLLLEAMKLPSPEHGLTEASLEALGVTKKDEVRETLRANAVRGKPTRVRVGALKGYTKLGSFHDADLAVIKEILPGDEDFVVRSQALVTIGELLDKRLVDTLRDVASKDTDHRNRRKAVEVLTDMDAASPGNAVASLKDEVEKLKKENAEIRDTLSRSRTSTS